jgi:hypothetical protein
VITRVGGCEIRVVGVKQLRNDVTKVVTEITAPTRRYEVEYFVVDNTMEITTTNPGVLHREMRAIHAAWREMGVMRKVMVPLNWYQKLMGFNPANSYKRLFTRRWWEEVQEG